MIRLVNWDEVVDGKDIAEWFIELGHLNETDARIIRGRRDGKYQYEVASDANISVDTVKYRGNKLMQKYKRLSKSYPDILKMKKEYENVSAAVSLITKTGEVYSVAFDSENFDTFANIREYVMKEIEKKYNIKIEEIGEYKTCIGGSYTRNKTEG
jgi:DNA-binding CsgD family transcriptional regulator